MTARILLQHDPGRERTRKVLWASALVLLIVALAQPRWGLYGRMFSVRASISLLPWMYPTACWLLMAKTLVG